MKFRCKRVVFWALVILQTLLIFSFSFQTADQSSVLSEGITEQVKSREEFESQVSQEKGENGEMRYKSDFAVEMIARKQSQKLEGIIRKCAHAFLFFLLCFYIILLVQSYEIGGKSTVISAVLFSGSVAFADETIQLFSEGRAGMLTDVGIDIVGALFAAIIFVVGGFIYEKIKSGRSKVDN